jgi:tetratricopeptide (TPR) repeat protein
MGIRSIKRPAKEVRAQDRIIKAFLADITIKNHEDADRLKGLSSPNGLQDIQLLTIAVNIAGRLGDWLAVIAIEDRMRSLGVTSVDAYSWQFDALWGLERYQAADRLLIDALKIFPDSHQITVKWARLATFQRNYSVAALRWAEVLVHHPGIQEAYLTGAFCFKQAEDLPAALSLLRDGITTVPGALDIWLRYLDYALDADDIDAARACWDECLVAFAANGKVLLAGARMEILAGNYNTAKTLIGESVALSGGQSANEHEELTKLLHNSEMKKIVMQFESLGGRMEGCEFGLVQRAFGAEPLGLLRWADMAPDCLVDALEHDFEGVGDPETTILSSPHADGADWTSQHTRYGMNMHTFQYDIESYSFRELFFKSLCRWLRYRTKKILEDLRSGNKIFVYKVSYENLDGPRLDRLHDALRKHGPGVLLYVRQPDAQHPAGTVEWAKPGLMIGYIRRFSYGFGHGAQKIGPAPECWEEIIRTAYSMWKEARDTHIMLP